MAMASSKPKTNALAWKHIGLYGHSIGTFKADPAAIQWKSTILDDDNILISRLLPASSLTSSLWTVFGRSAHLRIQTKGEEKNLPGEMRFDGFPSSDYEKIRSTLRSLYDIDCLKHTMSSSGASFGKTDVAGRHLVFRQCIMDEEEEEGEDGDEMMSLALGEVSQCVLPGNTRNEIELQFHESDAVEAGTDQLVSIRLYIPPDAEADANDAEQATSAELFRERIVTMANVKNTTGSVIAEFDESKGTFLTPRGRYNIELFDSFLRMRGNKYDYKIKYDDISRLFLLPKPDDVHMAFVIALDRPIRQGQQRYQYLVLQTTKQQSEVSISLDAETLERDYNNDLQPVMTGSLSNLVAKTFKVITRKKVFVPGKFANSHQQACVKCALRANEGHLYPLEKQFIFIHKPSVLIRFDEIESVEFQRYAAGGHQGATRNFDLCVALKDNSVDGGKEYVFSGIDRGDYAALYSFLGGKKIKIKNLEEDGPLDADQEKRKALYNEAILYKQGEAESSEDEDYEAPGAESESEDISSEDNSDDNSDGSEEDSDIEEARRKASREVVKNKPSKPSKLPPKKPVPKSPAPPSKKRKLSSTPSKPKTPIKVESVKKAKKQKDPNAPKRNLTSFMMFSNAERATIKEKNPSATFGEIAKLVGLEFKALDEKDKKMWATKAKIDKDRYMEQIEAYNKENNIEPTAAASKAKGPKKSLSSYNYFFRAKREEIVKNNPGAAFGEISKMVGRQFQQLTEQEKKKYEDLADRDKERYNKEMEEHGPISNTKGKPKKKVKDPDAPKRNLSSYMFFAQKDRARVVEENPDATFGEIGRFLGIAFKALDPEDRKPYEESAAADKRRYERENAAYKEKKKAQEAEENESTEEDSDDSDSVKEKKEDSGSAESDTSDDDSTSESDSDSDSD